MSLVSFWLSLYALLFLYSLLSELTRQVEASTREVGMLGARVGHAHSQGLEEREQNTRAQEEHLKSEQLEGGWERGREGGREKGTLWK